MARRRKGRKDAIAAPSFPYCAVIPDFLPRHSRESGNPEICGRRWDACERRMSARLVVFPSPSFPLSALLKTGIADAVAGNRPRNGGRKIKREILIQLGNHNDPTQEFPPMTRIRFIPAQVKTFPDERPDACKYCGSQILTQHGAVEKSVIDLYEDKVTTIRYRCSDCGRTFRHCPEGIDRGGQTQRMGGARVGARPVAALREPPSRRLRRLGIAHERVARRSGSGTKRARQTGRGRGRTGESHRRGRDRGSREGREKGRRRSRGRGNRAGFGAGSADRARRGRLHGVAWRLRKRLRGRGDSHRRPEHVQAGRSTSWNRPSDLHSPREKVGVEPSRRDRRLGLGQGEDMAVADGASLRRRRGSSASGADG